MDTVKLGPWPLGMDVCADDAAVEKGGRARLLANCAVSARGTLSPVPALEHVVAAPGAHSLVEFSGALLFASDGMLLRWVPGEAPSEVREVGHGRIEWCLLGDAIFACGPSRFLIDASGAVAAWGVPPFRDVDGVFFSSPQPRGGMQPYKGAILYAEGNLLRWTEPFQPHVTAPYRNFATFESDIRMIAALNDGCWVAGATWSVFLTGVPGDWRQAARTTVGALGWQVVRPHNNADQVVWLSGAGVVVASADGSLAQPGKAAIDVNAGVTAAGCISIAGEEFALFAVDSPAFGARAARAAFAITQLKE